MVTHFGNLTRCYTAYYHRFRSEGGAIESNENKFNLLKCVNNSVDHRTFAIICTQKSGNHFPKILYDL